MPEWIIQHRHHNGTIIDEFKPANEISIDINNNLPSSATYQLARSDPMIGIDRFAPYRTDCFIYRGDKLIISGPHTSRKWSATNEGVVDVAMNDWMHLLEKLYFPVGVTDDNMDVSIRKTAYKVWGVNQALDGAEPTLDTRYGIALDTIVRELLEYRNEVDTLQWSVAVMPNGGNISNKTYYTAFGLDNTTMYDHIKKLSDLHLGFDFDCKFIDTNEIQVRLWHPTRDSGTPVWYFEAGAPDSSGLSDFTWEDTGPKATRTYGLGQGHGPVGNLADVSAYLPSDEIYRQLEVQEDVGELADLYQYDDIADDETLAIKKLTGAMGFRNRGPVHTVDMSFLTNIFPFNFWTNIHPGDRFHIDYDMGFHRVNADYIMLGYSARINANGDELITPDLEKIEPL